MKERELARLFFLELKKIYHLGENRPQEKIQALYHLLGLLFLEVTRDEKLQFTTLFARVTYVCQKRGLPKQQQYYIHHFRKRALEELDSAEEREKVYQLGLQVLADAISEIFGLHIPEETRTLLPGPTIFPQPSTEVEAFKQRVRVVATAIDAEAEQLIAADPENPNLEIRIQYNISDRNENFSPTIKALRNIFGFPITLNLLEVEIDKKGIYRPRGFVVEPDYLVDVTAVAECFKASGLFTPGYLLKKFLPFETSIPLMVGNIANFFLDELMSNASLNFKELFARVFRLNPLAFALMSDREVREVMQKSQRHFLNIKQMVISGFREKEIDPEGCFLEPSFYAEAYGLQGRLDIFYPNTAGRGAIVELKSGKPFRPNIYGLSHNHFTQTLLYDLMVKAIFGKKLELVNYILYSALEQDILRFAPSIKAQQMEALQARNQLLAIERQLIQLLEKGQLDDSAVFRLLDTHLYPQLKGYLKKDLDRFSAVFRKMSPLERHYFSAFSSFIAREHQLAKTGVQGLESANGQAALWRNAYAEKEMQFEIISYLEVEENKADADEPILSFRKTDRTNPLANFRRGDIAVLYPFRENKATVLYNQIFKCTILEIDDEKVVVRLRSRQFNASLFEQEPCWNLEHDLLDSSFIGMYRQLFAFMEGPKEKRDLLFTRRAPRKGLNFPQDVPNELTQEQQQLFKKIVAAEDYFLLWGPPGTGKTSKMLKNLVGYLWDHTDEELLLLAYTNRAVDEICEAIESYHPDLKHAYLRIGSRHSTDQRFSHSLLEEKMEGINSRKNLKGLIRDHRIFIATVASISGKSELLKLKHFHRVIIDEASQILEPMLVGLLPSFDRFVLIGDHKQLPAVVVQNEEYSKVPSPGLRSIGLENLRDSLFERLFRRAQSNEWHWAYGKLSRQGRMHADIMHFPNHFFYQDQLQTLPEEIRFSQKQTEAPSYRLPGSPSPLDKVIISHRVLFLPTPADNRSLAGKTNAYEAELVAQLIQRFQAIYQENNLTFTPSSLGVITPYRAQIAQLRKTFQEKNIPLQDITIDTVERYQGGARDIIILSLCTNRYHQLESLVNLSTEGVDRKLNVALTRARKHLILVGNPELLRENEIYRAFIEQYQVSSSPV
jgi:DNA replication ATP-dependent helicase Dna2